MNQTLSKPVNQSTQAVAVLRVTFDLVYMHPSRVVALCFFFVSVLLVAQVGIMGDPGWTAGAMLQLIGGVFLLLTSLFGLVRYEQNPIISEYEPMTYLLIFGLAIWAVGLLIQLVTA